MKFSVVKDKLHIDSRAAARVKKLTGKGVRGIIKAVFLIGFCFVILYPILMMISKAFMAREDIFDNTVFWSARLHAAKF